jgi:hypothetical protein
MIRPILAAPSDLLIGGYIGIVINETHGGRVDAHRDALSFVDVAMVVRLSLAALE